MRWILGKYGEDVGKDIPMEKKNQVFFWMIIGAIAFGVAYVLSFYF